MSAGLSVPFPHQQKPVPPDPVPCDEENRCRALHKSVLTILLRQCNEKMRRMIRSVFLPRSDQPLAKEVKSCSAWTRVTQLLSSHFQYWQKHIMPDVARQKWRANRFPINPVTVTFRLRRLARMKIGGDFLHR